MSKKTDKNNLKTKFDPERVSKAGPDNDLLLDYESERIVAGKGGMEKTVGYNLPPKKSDIRYGKKVDPERRVHRYHGPGVGLLVCVMLFLVVLACAACGGTVWAWNNYAYPYVNLSLPEAISLASEMYEADPSKIVTNPYEPKADLDSFYASFKEGMYLADDCNITIRDIVNAVLPEESEGEQTGDDVNAENPDTGSEQLNALLEMLKFDFDSLDKKQNAALENEVLEISDKELAAVLNEAMQIAFDMEQINEVTGQLGEEIKNVVKVEQVVIEDVESVTKQENTRVLVTVSVNIGDNITAIANNAYNNILRPSLEEDNPDLVKTLDDVVDKAIPVLQKILPKVLYLTVAVYPNDSGKEALITYNNVVDNNKQELIDKVFAGELLQIAGVDVNLNGVIDYEEEQGQPIPQIVSSIVAGTIESMSETITLNFTNTEDNEGVFRTKPIEFMLSILGADNISQAQFLAIMRDIQVPYDRMTAKYDENTAYSELTLAQNLQYFIDGDNNDVSFTSKYYFNNEREDGSSFINTDNIFTSIDSMMTEEMIDRIMIKSSEEWKQNDGYNADAHKPMALYNALPGLINGYLSSETEGGIAGMPAKVLAAGYENGSLVLTIKAELLALVEESLGGEEEGESDPMADIVGQLIPEAIYLNVIYPLDGSGATTITINDVDEDEYYGEGQSAEDFETIFNLLALFGVNLEMETESGVIVIDNYDEICEMVGDTIASAFDEIANRLGGELIFIEDGVLFPNIFQVISANQIFGYTSDEIEAGISQEEFDKEYAPSDEDIYNILAAMYGYGTPDKTVEDSVDNLREQLSDKYYVTFEKSESGEGQTEASVLLGQIEGLKDNFENSVRMKEQEVNNVVLSGMVDDERSTDELKPQLNSDDIATLVEASGELSMASVSTIKDVEVRQSRIYINENGNACVELILTAMTIDFSNAGGDAAKFENLFPDTLSIIVTIEQKPESDTSEGRFNVTYNINGIEDELMTKTMFFMTRLSGDESMSQDSIEETINTGVNGAFDKLDMGGMIDIDITVNDQNEGVVQLDTIFAIATAELWAERDEEGNITGVIEGKPTDDEFRGTIKALWSGLPEYGYANGDAIDKLGYTANVAPFYVEPHMDGITLTSVTADTRISDAFIGSQIIANNNMEKIAQALQVHTEGIDLYQALILPANDEKANETYGEKGRYVGVKEYFNGTGLIQDGEANMLFTFELSKAAFSEEGQKNNLIPDAMYVSASIPIGQELNADTEIKILINKLTTEQADIVKRIMEIGDYGAQGLFGANSEIAQNIGDIVLVKLTVDELGEYGDAAVAAGFEEVDITVNMLFAAAGDGTHFASEITSTDQYENNYIYWDLVGDYEKADPTDFMEGWSAPDVKNVALGYMAYSYEYVIGAQQ